MGKEKETSSVRSLLAFLKRHAPAVALVAGFLWDTLTLHRPDQLFSNAVLVFYLLVAGAGIVFMHARRSVPKGERESWLVPAIVQFSFGNLASGMLVLYGKSGTFEGSLLFFLILGGFLLGNEFLKSRYERLYFQAAAYYLLLLLYFGLSFPILLAGTGTLVFLASQAASVVVFAGFMGILYLFARESVREHRSGIVATVMAIIVGFNALYAFNVIPPVPLALKDIGVYHTLVKLGDTYEGWYEPAPWYAFWRRFDSTFRVTMKSDVYCFSSVYAPTRLETPVYHVWEFLNPETGGWIESTRVSFPIVGGRESGYRGFSAKLSVPPGRWRCSVETGRGALLGRAEFVVTKSATAPLLRKITL